MKKLITAVVVGLAVSAVTLPAKADATALVIAGAFMMGHASTQPTPYNLTDACQAQTVKTEGSNISYTSYEHCLKK